MKTNNKPFMESYRNMFEVGDIVWWSEWETKENYEYVSTDLLWRNYRNKNKKKFI